MTVRCGRLGRDVGRRGREVGLRRPEAPADAVVCLTGGEGRHQRAAAASTCNRLLSVSAT